MEFQLTVWVAEPMSSLSLSFDHNISVYDSTYLCLTMAHNSTLWTIDKELGKVAESLGMLVEPRPGGV